MLEKSQWFISFQNHVIRSEIMQTGQTWSEEEEEGQAYSLSTSTFISGKPNRYVDMFMISLISFKKREFFICELKDEKWNECECE